MRTGLKCTDVILDLSTAKTNTEATAMSSFTQATKDSRLAQID
jgi:hypothetical protein